MYVHMYNELITTGVPEMVSNISVDIKIVYINGNSVTLTLSWEEPFNNLDPIVNYTVSCSGDVTCPPNFTTTDNTTRSYTITNLTPMTDYTFSVIATNPIGSGEAGVVMITTPGIVMNMYIRMYACKAYIYIHSYVILLQSISEVYMYIRIKSLVSSKRHPYH